jgi:hypothetical protein
MVKAKVLFTFLDKYTHEQRLVGDVVELEESRAAELKALGAVDFAQEPKIEAKEEEPKKKATTRRAKK